MLANVPPERPSPAESLMLLVDPGQDLRAVSARRHAELVRKQSLLLAADLRTLFDSLGRPAVPPAPRLTRQ